MTIQIKTNNVPRLLIQGFELSDKERKEYDQLDNIDERTFFRYKGNVYLLDDILTTRHVPDLKGWHGYTSDTLWSGICIKLVEDDESVIVGTYQVEG